MALLNFLEEARRETQKKILRTTLRAFMWGKDLYKERSFILLSLPYTPMQLLCP